MCYIPDWEAFCTALNGTFRRGKKKLKWKKLRPKYPAALSSSAKRNLRGRFEFDYGVDIETELENLRETFADAVAVDDMDDDGVDVDEKDSDDNGDVTSSVCESISRLR
ncbi:hypothetical protein CAPTEDRAFT_196797 [Capitella teleta]|uniref:Uncharacterized protein n=1 Tax=Capitella teleta TaxID=283909 RepID=R7UXB5_CAPTE|nr:hypothetical protein CAPTEDRAFT_196797 [Capitella teleta]|eukprot:ELU10942.1 hypothetical protein CAPTEDRAFT_196797 [Capitella teleta]